MPFMFGYHPAFKLSGNLNEYFKLENEKKVSISDVIKEGSSAFPLLNEKNITLVRDDNFEIDIKTIGFRNIMLWAEVSNMVCIESGDLREMGISLALTIRDYYDDSLTPTSLLFKSGRNIKLKYPELYLPHYEEESKK